MQQFFNLILKVCFDLQNETIRIEYIDVFCVIKIFFLGFTKLSSSLKSSEVVSLLHLLYEYYDSYAKELDVEKIETIGDAYICVKFDGSTDNILQFALKVVDTHLAMQNFIIEDTYSNASFRESTGKSKDVRKRKLTWDAALAKSRLLRTKNGSFENTVESQNTTDEFDERCTLDGRPIRNINVRIGIATGECHGCVVGKSGLRFHLFGPALDQAIHLEGIAGQQQILVCAKTKNRSKNRFIKFIPHDKEIGAYLVKDTVRSTVSDLAHSWVQKIKRQVSPVAYGSSTVYFSDDDE